VPEGHTLHALARGLDAAFAGTTPRATSPQGKFADGASLIDGRELLHAEAYGKHLFVEFAGETWLNVHLGLIGTFTIDTVAYAGEVPVAGQVRLRLQTDEHVADLRGPNLCRLITAGEVDATTARLGPDPLRRDADPETAWVRIHRSGRSIAELLMDQEVLAGVGNVYRSEVLFRHRVKPSTPGKRLRRRTWDALWKDLADLMPLGVATGKIVTITDQVEDVRAALARGETVRPTDRDSYVYRRAGEACLACGSRIRTQVVAGRNLFWCGNCQRRA
jgi:endonuclease-8